MHNPTDLFRQWYLQATHNSPLQHPRAVCGSTVNQKGEPEARFVALKEVSEAGFTFCSAFDSPKGVEIDANSNVALTFWWDHIGRQVRVVGTATRISDEEADRYFAERRKDAQLTSLVSEQSQPLERPEALETRLREAEAKFEGQEVPRPENWGGYCVKPERLELLTFKANRLHERTLFTLKVGGWSKQRLQP